MDAVRIPVSFGDLVDKLTILEIKAARIEDAGKIENVQRELDALRAVWTHHFGDGFGAVGELAARLKEINLKLWVTEDEIRDCEHRNDFGAAFVRLARSVYQTNDERAAIKRAIDTLLGSPLREEKSYKPYRADRVDKDRPEGDGGAGKSHEAG